MFRTTQITNGFSFFLLIFFRTTFFHVLLQTTPMKKLFATFVTRYYYRTHDMISRIFRKRIYEFCLPKYYVITVLIYSTVQNWENNHKEFVCFFNRQMLARKSVDSCSENSWKHVMNSIIADTRSCQRECRMIEDCKFFTMFGVNDDPTDHMKCLLFKTCDPLEACDDCITGIYIYLKQKLMVFSFLC